MIRSKNALKILEHSIGHDSAMRRRIAAEGVRFEISQLVYDARSAAKLTQTQLARKIGTTQSVISRLEDADYRGHSLTMLQRIAEALDLDLVVRLSPRSGSRRHA